MRNYTKTPVSARLSLGRSNKDNEIHPTLTIEDKISGQRIVEIDLTASQLVDMIAGGAATVLADVLTDEIYAQRVGSQIEVKRVDPEEWPEGWTARNPSAEKLDFHTTEATEEMKNFGLTAMRTHGFQEFFWSLHNYGWSLTLRRWNPLSEFDRVEKFNDGRYL